MTGNEKEFRVHSSSNLQWATYKESNTISTRLISFPNEKVPSFWRNSEEPLFMIWFVLKQRLKKKKKFAEIKIVQVLPLQRPYFSETTNLVNGFLFVLKIFQKPASWLSLLHCNTTLGPTKAWRRSGHKNTVWLLECEHFQLITGQLTTQKRLRVDLEIDTHENQSLMIGNTALPIKNWIAFSWAHT